MKENHKNQTKWKPTVIRNLVLTHFDKKVTTALCTPYYKTFALVSDITAALITSTA